MVDQLWWCYRRTHIYNQGQRDSRAGYEKHEELADLILDMPFLDFDEWHRDMYIDNYINQSSTDKVLCNHQKYDGFIHQL